MPWAWAFPEGDQNALPSPCHGLQAHRALSFMSLPWLLCPALQDTVHGIAQPGVGVGDMPTIAQVTAWGHHHLNVKNSALVVKCLLAGAAHRAFLTCPVPS